MTKKAIKVLVSDDGHTAAKDCPICGGTGWYSPDGHYDDHCLCRSIDDPHAPAGLRFDWKTSKIVPR